LGPLLSRLKHQSLAQSAFVWAWLQTITQHLEEWDKTTGKPLVMDIERDQQQATGTKFSTRHMFVELKL
jgi:hypothetical protein